MGGATVSQTVMLLPSLQQIVCVIWSVGHVHLNKKYIIAHIKLFVTRSLSLVSVWRNIIVTLILEFCPLAESKKKNRLLNRFYKIKI